MAQAKPTNTTMNTAKAPGTRRAVVPNEDMYAKMFDSFERLRLEFKSDIKALNEKLDNASTVLNDKLDNTNKVLNDKLDNNYQSKQMSDERWRIIGDNTQKIEIKLQRYEDLHLDTRVKDMEEKQQEDDNHKFTWTQGVGLVILSIFLSAAFSIAIFALEKALFH